MKTLYSDVSLLEIFGVQNVVFLSFIYAVLTCVSLIEPCFIHIVVKALGYKLEGRRFETRWGEILNLPNPSGHTRPWSLLNRNKYRKH
jgi:hypothetical protein